MKKTILLLLFIVFSFGGNFEEAAKIYISGLNTDDAAVLFKKSCEEDRKASGCYMTAYILDINGDDENLSKANALYKLACDMGDSDSCDIVAKIYSGERAGEGKDMALTTKYSIKACDGGVSDSCLRLGQKFDSGDGVTKDYAKAVNYYKKACDKKSATACYNLGNMSELGEGLAMDIRVAIEYYGLACDYGDNSGCAKYRELSKKN